MQRCFDLAMIPGSNVAPNPLVGCVIVRQNKIISEGYHQYFGGPHAEVEAIKSVQDAGKLTGATLYVNLEPCSHHGKTPPCVNLILGAGIKRVVIANSDPNPLVNGNGIRILQENNVEVQIGVLEKDGEFLNRRFFTQILKKRPYIILKWAKSSDGYISKMIDGYPVQTQISNPQSMVLSHKWRNEEQAILIGHHTLSADKPTLTTRLWPGKNPHKVVIASSPLSEADQTHLKNNPGFNVIGLQNGQNRESSSQHFVAETDPGSICKVLNDLNFSSVLVEGGTKILQSFINSGLWDECRIITSNMNLHCGVEQPIMMNKPAYRNTLGNNIIEYYFNFE